jgi:hypothetical protein
VEEGRWERDAAIEIEMREEAGDGGGTQGKPTVVPRWGWKGRTVLVEAWRGRAVG